MGLVAGRVMKIDGEVRSPGEPVPEFLTDPVRKRKLQHFLDNGWVRRTEEEGIRPEDLDGMSARDVIDGLAAGTLDPDVVEAYNESRADPWVTVRREIEKVRASHAESDVETPSDGGGGDDAGDNTGEGDNG